MLLAELLKDDVKDSLYAKTKDYYVGDELFSPPFRIRKLEVDRFCIVDNAGKIIPNSVTKSLYAASEKLKDIKFKFTPRQNQDSCKVGDARQIIFKYKLDGEVKTIKMPVREILRYSNKNASEAATRYLSENFPGAKLIEVGTSDSCKVGDVTFGGKGYKCTKCHATADSVHKIVHVKDDSESKLYEIENEVSNKI